MVKVVLTQSKSGTYFSVPVLIDPTSIAVLCPIFSKKASFILLNGAFRACVVFAYSKVSVVVIQGLQALGRSKRENIFTFHHGLLRASGTGDSPKTKEQQLRVTFGGETYFPAVLHAFTACTGTLCVSSARDNVEAALSCNSAECNDT